jgi:hypothetical protein
LSVACGSKTTDFRFQISDFRFQISDFRFQFSDLGFEAVGDKITDKKPPLRRAMWLGYERWVKFQNMRVDRWDAQDV